MRFLCVQKHNIMHSLHVSIYAYVQYTISHIWLCVGKHNIMHFLHKDLVTVHSNSNTQFHIHDCVLESIILCIFFTKTWLRYIPIPDVVNSDRPTCWYSTRFPCVQKHNIMHFLHVYAYVQYTTSHPWLCVGKHNIMHFLHKK